VLGCGPGAVSPSPTGEPPAASSSPDVAGPDLTPVPGAASQPPTPFASIRIGPDEPDTSGSGGS
jgi:hypothetical protein